MGCKDAFLEAQGPANHGCAALDKLLYPKQDEMQGLSPEVVF